MDIFFCSFDMKGVGGWHCSSEIHSHLWYFYIFFFINGTPPQYLPEWKIKEEGYIIAATISTTYSLWCSLLWMSFTCKCVICLCVALAGIGARERTRSGGFSGTYEWVVSFWLSQLVVLYFVDISYLLICVSELVFWRGDRGGGFTYEWVPSDVQHYHCGVVFEDVQKLPGSFCWDPATLEVQGWNRDTE